MELIKVINAKQAIEKLADNENIGAHLAYWMTKFVTKSQKEHEFYIDEMRKIVAKHGQIAEDGMVNIDPDKVDDFNKAVQDLQTTDVEEPGIRFSLSEISRELKLSMKQIYPLIDFIDEDK